MIPKVYALPGSYLDVFGILQIFPQFLCPNCALGAWNILFLAILPKKQVHGSGWLEFVVCFSYDFYFPLYLLLPTPVWVLNKLCQLVQLLRCFYCSSANTIWTKVLCPFFTYLWFIFLNRFFYRKLKKNEFYKCWLIFLLCLPISALLLF